jgi:hypothetical protein
LTSRRDFSKLGVAKADLGIARVKTLRKRHRSYHEKQTPGLNKPLWQTDLIFGKWLIGLSPASCGSVERKNFGIVRTISWKSSLTRRSLQMNS